MSASLRISANDERLAHGIVKSAALATADNVPRLGGAILKSKRMDTFIEANARHFSWRMVSIIKTAKTYGSRARCSVFAIEPHDDSGDYGLMRLDWKGVFPHVNVVTYDVRLRRHAIARWLQRSGGGSVDVDASIGALWPYVLMALGVEAPRFCVTGPEGEARFTKSGPGKLTLETWIGSERATPEMSVRLAA